MGLDNLREAAAAEAADREEEKTRLTDENQANLAAAAAENAEKEATLAEARDEITQLKAKLESPSISNQDSGKVADLEQEIENLREAAAAEAAEREAEAAEREEERTRLQNEHEASLAEAASEHAAKLAAL